MRVEMAAAIGGLVTAACQSMLFAAPQATADSSDDQQFLSLLASQGIAKIGEGPSPTLLGSSVMAANP
jgi:hypothetical protein